jgi:ferredoxin
VKIVHPRIDYNKCVGLLECYGVCPADVFDAEESIEGQRALVARPEDVPSASSAYRPVLQMQYSS